MENALAQCSLVYRFSLHITHHNIATIGGRLPETTSWVARGSLHEARPGWVIARCADWPAAPPSPLLTFVNRGPSIAERTRSVRVRFFTRGPRGRRGDATGWLFHARMYRVTEQYERVHLIFTLTLPHLSFEHCFLLKAIISMLYGTFVE